MKKVLRSHPSSPLMTHKSFPSEPLVTAATSFSPITAHLMRGALEQYGIHGFLSNEMIAAVDLPVSHLGGGVHVLVRQSDQAQAVSILQSLENQNTL